MSKAKNLGDVHRDIIRAARLAEQQGLGAAAIQCGKSATDTLSLRKERQMTNEELARLNAAISAHQSVGVIQLETGDEDAPWVIENGVGEVVGGNYDTEEEARDMLPAHCMQAALEAAGLNELVELEEAITLCNKDTFECPVCGHSEPWWTDSNADHITYQRHSAALTGDKTND